jgi:uncharacterized RDD family membrane protein YckC
MDDAEPCTFCEDSVENPELQPVAAGEAGDAESDEPEWRQEVGRRLAKYRARHGRANPVEAQPSQPERQAGLLFREPPKGTQTLEIKERARPRTLARLRPAERMEICIQPELDFSAAAGERARPQTALVPVATLGERRNAGALDAIFILISCAAFIGLFVGLMRSMGGEIVVDRIAAAVFAPVLYLFYSLYFLVFTVFAGSTPGMQFCGLNIVRLDGRLPDTNHLLWRGFGYLLSGGTLMLGFLWAFWDEDTFTWQDRISQTYVTSSNPLCDPDPIEVSGARRSTARR